MLGHLAYRNMKHVCELAARRGEPYVPFDAREFYGWTWDDLELLPALRFALTPAPDGTGRIVHIGQWVGWPKGWVVAGHDHGVPKTRDDAAGWAAWVRSTVTMFEEADARDDELAMIRYGNSIAYLRRST